LLCQKWIDLCQIKTKMISSPFCTYCQIHFVSANAWCLWYSVISDYLGVSHVAAAQCPCTYLLICKLENVFIKNNNINGWEFCWCANGRRMFPALQVQVSGLDRCARYALALDVVPVNEFRYRFHGSGWTIAGVAASDEVTAQRIYVHPDSPMTGQQWMSRSVSFTRLKLTNNARDNRGYVRIAFSLGYCLL